MLDFIFVVGIVMITVRYIIFCFYFSRNSLVSAVNHMAARTFRKKKTNKQKNSLSLH